MTFFTGELRRDKRTEDLKRELNADDTRAETEHVAVVMFARLVRGIGVAAKRRANAAKFVRSHGRTDTAAANQNTDLRPTRLHRFAN